MKFEYRDIPAELVEAAEKWRETWSKPAAEASEELMNKYLEEVDLSEEEIKAGTAPAYHRYRNPAHAVRLRVQEQGCAAHARTPCWNLPPAPIDIPDVYRYRSR